MSLGVPNSQKGINQIGKTDLGFFVSFPELSGANELNSFYTNEPI